MLNTQRNENTNVTVYIGSFLKHRRKVVEANWLTFASLKISQQQVSRYERGKNAITIKVF